MAKALLVGPALEEGLRFVEKLEESGIPIRAAVWHRPPMTTWRLTIVSPLLDTKDSRTLFERTNTIFEEANPKLGFDKDAIYYASPRTVFARNLREHNRGWENQEWTLYDMEGDAHEAFIYFVK